MSATVIVGAQWGDEAKGKIVDFLAAQAKYVIRYSGGNNAGHTIIIGEEVFKFQLLPAGLLRKECTSILGSGMAICPKSLLEEYDALRARVKETGDLKISGSAHIVFPFHRLLDSLEEEARGKDRIGTTSRGIGPCYTDKVSRIGIRMGELVDPDLFAERLRALLDVKNRLLAMFGQEPLDYDSLLKEYLAYGERLRPFVCDTESLAAEALRSGAQILFEGAQGTLLDLDSGTYPYVTSSNPTAGGACTGSGIGPLGIGAVLGVCKAYSTRVGEGPFPTELHDEVGAKIRERGNEFGTVTGRARRCGWLDLVALRYSARINTMNGLVLTRLDVLSGLEALKLCTGYKINGVELNQMPFSASQWHSIEPVYQEIAGWSEDITQCKTLGELPEAAKRYVRFVEEFIEVPVAVLSIGPERDQTLVLREDLLWVKR